MQIWLYIGDQNSGEQRVMPLPESGVTIGRGDTCDVRTEAATVSRRHATITRQNSQWIVTDQQSSGGTFVNDQRVTQAPLRNGDIVRCGSMTLRFIEPSSSRAGAPSQVSAREVSANSGVTIPFRSQVKGYIFTDGCEPSAENIDRVLVFLPIFEDTSRSFFEQTYKGTSFSPEVQRFIQVAVEQGLVCESNAVRWLAQKAMLYRDPAAISSADLYTCQRLLSSVVDDDPQVVLKLPEALSSGLIYRVLSRLRAIRGEMRAAQRPILEDGRLQLLLTDIVNMGVDVIACASDNTLGGNGKLERSIRERAGSDFVAAVERVGGCPEGEARLFAGARLPASGVVFTNPTDFRGGQFGEDVTLVRCYESCLNLAAQNGAHTIAFPAIGTGALHFPPKRAAELAVATVRRYLTNNPQGPIWKVYFASFDDASYRACESAMRAPPIVLPDPLSKTGAPSKNGGKSGGQISVLPAGGDAGGGLAVPLPNPEARPIPVFLKQEFLINCLFSQVTLEAYRLSRTLLNDPTSKLETLDRMVTEWLAAHAGGPSAEMKQLDRWDNDKLDGPQLLRELCDRMAIVALGSNGGQQSSCLYGFRVFLRALRDAYFVQAKMFGYDTKLSSNPGVTGNPHKPKARELVDAWSSVYRGSILSYRSERMRAQEPSSFAATKEARPLVLGDAALHLQIVRNLSIGTPTLAGGGDDYFLITGYMATLDRYYHLRVHTGATEMVARARYSSSSLPIDYVLIPDPDVHPDISRYDLSPANPETASSG